MCRSCAPFCSPAPPLAHPSGRPANNFSSHTSRLVNIEHIRQIVVRYEFSGASALGNGIASSICATSNTVEAFIGKRILVTNFGGCVTVFKAADLGFIANAPTGVGSGPFGARSDGINFWVTLNNTAKLLRF
jgi:hypothetical protein